MATVEPVVTEQPDDVTLATHEKEGEPMSSAGKWSSGLLGCCGDKKSCFLGALCSPILACKVSGKMNECFCAGCIAPAALRTKYRIEHGVQGSVCTDSLLSCFCTPCVLCQLTRDLNTR